VVVEEEEEEEEDGVVETAMWLVVLSDYWGNEGCDG